KPVPITSSQPLEVQGPGGAPMPVTSTQPLTVTFPQPLAVQGPGGDPISTTITNVPTVRSVPEHFHAAGSGSALSAGRACTAKSLTAGIPAGRTAVLTSLATDASDTVEPELVLWLRQQTGSGFFTHFLGVPLTHFAQNGVFSGTLQLDARVVPGSTAA